MHISRQFLAVTLFAAAVLSLTACGGGGGDTAATPVATLPATEVTPTPAPVVTPTPTPTPTPAPATFWHPAVTDTWQWQLTGTLNTAYDVKVYDVDLYDTPAATILALQNSGKKVLCYFSAGSSENWRADFGSFAAADMGNALDGWAGGRWLNTGSANVRTIMTARLDLAKTKGCNGVEPDNVDGYANSTGFALTAATQLDYNRFLATAAHARGLAIALKNNVGQLADLVGDVDMAVNEQCHQYNECGGYAAFVSAGKPVFNAEYAKAYQSAGSVRDALCADAKKLGLRTLVLPLALNDSTRFSCD
ncbi:MAG: endo alpha-1,4 polygalactosaminidase [Pseudomonadota bacterium]|nr:endo alpha-1,4 polygalactosaminidase [Pseudomonadota bacterium]